MHCIQNEVVNCCEFYFHSVSPCPPPPPPPPLHPSNCLPLVPCLLLIACVNTTPVWDLGGELMLMVGRIGPTQGRATLYVVWEENGVYSNFCFEFCSILIQTYLYCMYLCTHVRSMVHSFITLLYSTADFCTVEGRARCGPDTKAHLFALWVVSFLKCPPLVYHGMLTSVPHVCHSSLIWASFGVCGGHHRAASS